jgi:subtilase family serine protease
VITVSDTTTNQGSTPAAGSTVAFYLSTNTTLDAGDVFLGSRTVPALGPGASSSGSTSVTVPSGTATGTWYLIARADSDGVVAETNELNDTALRVLQVGPDLIVATWTIPATATAGVPITVADTTANQGGGAAGASTTRFYLSTNALLDSGDVPLGSRQVPSLAPAATSAGSTSLTIPAGTAPGRYFLIIAADADGTVAETQEGNNIGLAPIQVAPGS